MTSRFWQNDASGGTPISADWLNGIEADLDARTPRSGATVKPVGVGELGVNVLDYLPKNRVVGTTDDLAYIHQATGTGSIPRDIYFPAGHYWVSSAVLQQDNSTLRGDGIGATFIHLLPSASSSTWVITNATRDAGNKNLRVEDMTLDWNQGRQGGMGPAGGTRSCCLSYGNVDGFELLRVKGDNAGQHCFDFSHASLDYQYFATGTDDPAYVPVGPSKNGRVVKCLATNFEDDGFTTHSSGDIEFVDCFGYLPRARKNCNAFEVDGGSYNITLTNTRSWGCYGGIEVKGHHDENAAKNTVINGHRSYLDVRPYHWRHIGHHVATDPKSRTAYDIIATNIEAVYPGNRSGFQEDTESNAMNISAYLNVQVTNATFIGDPNYNYGGAAVVVLRYMTNNVQLRGINIRGFLSAGIDIYITGGDQKADRILIDGVNLYKSAPKGIAAGTANPAVHVSNVNGVAPDTGAMYLIDLGFHDDVVNTGASVGGSVKQVGYPTTVRYAGTNYPTFDDWTYRSISVPDTVTNTNQLTRGGQQYYIPSGRTDPAVPASLIKGLPADAPTGAYFYTTGRYNSPGSTASFPVTLRRNSAGATSDPMQWERIANRAGAAGPWGRVTLTTVATTV